MKKSDKYNVLLGIVRMLATTNASNYDQSLPRLDSLAAPRYLSDALGKDFK